MEARTIIVNKKASEFYMTERGNETHIFCVKHNKGTCPAENPFAFIKAINDRNNSDLSDRNWFIHKGYGVSEYKIRQSDAGEIHSFYMGNKALMHNHADDLASVLAKPLEPTCEMKPYANCQPVTIYPAKCTLAETGHIYWSSCYPGDEKDIVWADSKKLMDVWKSTTKNGGTPHVVTDPEQSLREGGAHLLRTSCTESFSTASVSYYAASRRFAFGKARMQLSFTNGRHRVANAVAFGCEAVPVHISSDNGRDALQRDLGSSRFIRQRP